MKLASKLDTAMITANMARDLAIAQKVVEAAGGRIWVQPRDGGGSVFCFTWPAVT